MVKNRLLPNEIFWDKGVELPHDVVLSIRHSIYLPINLLSIEKCNCHHSNSDFWIRNNLCTAYTKV